MNDMIVGTYKKVMNMGKLESLHESKYGALFFALVCSFGIWLYIFLREVGIL